jgi:tellurite resistance protein
VLKLAADESEELVDRGLQLLFDRHQPISLEAVLEALTEVRGAPSPAQGVLITPVDVSVYDGLLESVEVPDAAAV